MHRVRRLQDVVESRLCLGCGVCAYICPERRVQLFDFFDEGIRPVVQDVDCKDCRVCLDVCPGVLSDFRPGSPHGPQLSAQRLGSFPDHRPIARSAIGDPSFTRTWGLVTGLWEGHATDPDIRFRGSSGGALTALGAYCLEVLGMHGVLHIAQDPDDPIRNRTRLSRSRGELVAATGSRYSPASVCNGLGLVEASPSACAVIGRPSEIAAVRNARRLRPGLDAKIGVTLSFFCAESPSTGGTVALLQKLGVSPAAVTDLRYRGYGWPGHFAPVTGAGSEPVCRMTYRESWAFLQAYRPWSVQLWPDGTGEIADISCGDPWYTEPNGSNPGFSLVVARSMRGREIVEGAMQSGYLTLRQAESWKLVKSQSGLVSKKGSIWGRRLALRLLGLPVTHLKGAALWHCWKKLPVKEKVRSTLGTIRRVLSRGLYRRQRLSTQEAKPVAPPIYASDISHPPRIGLP